MLVKKLWKTEKRSNTVVSRVLQLKKWKGLFLFGFIPVYIENYETIYYD